MSVIDRIFPRDVGRPRGRLSRLVTSMLVALQAMALAGGPVLDAAVESSAARSVVHIEGANGTKCAAVHVGDCLVCRTLTDRGTPAPSTAAVPLGTGTGCAAPESVDSAAPRLIVGTLRSRAPPGASTHAPPA
jgi:hypothetical protein